MHMSCGTDTCPTLDEKQKQLADEEKAPSFENQKAELRRKAFDLAKRRFDLAKELKVSEIMLFVGEFL